MRITLPAFVFMLLLLGCSKSDKDTQPDDTQPVEINLPSLFDKDGLLIYKEPDTAIFNDYYTLIDTTIQNRVYPKSFGYLLADGNTAEYTWKINNSPVSNNDISTFIKWQEQASKWISASTIKIDMSKYTSPLTLNVDLKLPSKTITKQMKVVTVTNKIVRNLLNIDFGMSKDQVKENEAFRLKYDSFSTNASWREYLPNYCSYPTTKTSAFDANRVTLYEFVDNKLSAVSEMNLGLSAYASVDALNNIFNYAKKMGCPVNPEYYDNGSSSTYKYQLKQPVSWDNGKIKFTLAEFTHTLGASTYRSLGIKYEKK